MRPNARRAQGATSTLRPFWPVVLVLEDSNHPRALAACVLLHLHEDGKELGELRARVILALERENRTVGSADVAPDAAAVFDFDLEQHAAPPLPPWKQARPAGMANHC